jgi:cytochrome c-type biogenesis protein CcmF
MTGEGPLRALRSLVARNRRRYGGYLVHVGMALLFIGVAASTAFNDARDVRLTPGQTVHVGGYDFTYRQATSRVSTSGAGELEKISFGAIVDVRRDGRKIVTLRPERGYFPSRDVKGLGPVGRFFEGEATSEVGLKAGVRRDLWTAMTPDIRKLLPTIEEGDRVFTAAAGKLPPQLAGEALGQALNGIVNRYVSSKPAATFRVITSPLVTWIWIGSIVVFLGGLIALWPGPDRARGLVAAKYKARVAEDLSRA